MTSTGRRSRISIPRAAVEELCRRNAIRTLSLFGSVLRDDFGPASDIDVLVEFMPGARVGLLGLARIQNELADLFGRAVDLLTPGSLPPRLRGDILQSAEPLFVAA